MQTYKFEYRNEPDSMNRFSLRPTCPQRTTVEVTDPTDADVLVEAFLGFLKASDYCLDGYVLTLDVEDDEEHKTLDQLYEEHRKEVLEEVCQGINDCIRGHVSAKEIEEEIIRYRGRLEKEVQELSRS